MCSLNIEDAEVSTMATRSGDEVKCTPKMVRNCESTFYCHITTHTVTLSSIQYIDTGNFVLLSL